MNRQIFLFALLLTGLFALLTTASAQATNHPAYLSIPIAASQKAVDFIRTVRPQTQPQDVEQLVPLTVSKMPQPSVLPEPGGPVTFTITVTNTLSLRAVEITRLEDSIYGDVTQAGHDGVVATNCQVPQSLPILVGTYQCTFIARVQGNAGDKHENRLEVYIRNNESDELAGGGSATVTLTDLPSSLAIEKQAAVTSVPEAGATVVFTAVITNTSAVDRVQVKTLKDDHFGDVATDCTPKLPANLQPQAMITCHFSGFVREEAGGIHTNTVTVNGTDDDGNPVSANDSLTLTINDTPAVLTVSKVATPTTLAEPGGPVTFTVTVRNDSAADGILLTTLLDDQFGDVADSCQPALPTRLEPNAELTCTFTRPVTGQPATAHVNTVTTSGVSTDNVIVTADASATVTFLDQPSGIALVQSPNPATAPPNGGVVTFTVEVSNTSPVDAVTVETLVDSVYGDVTTPNPKLLTTNCSTPQTLAVGQEYVCQFSAQFSGPVRATQTHTLTVTATDDDGGALSAQAAATITIVGPLLRASKTVALINDQNGDNVASPGDALGYTVVIANQGNGADQVRLSDVVDPNTQILPQSVTTTQGIITASPPSMSVELGELGPAGVVTVSFTAQIVDPLPLGVSTVSNQGIVIGNLSPAIPTDDPTTPAVDDATATLVVAQPLLLAAKRVTLAADADGNGDPSPGDTLGYTISITNSGNQRAVAVVLSDPLDSFVTLKPASLQTSQGQILSQEGETTVRVALGDLAAGTTATVTFQVILPKPLPIGVFETSNQGQITSDNFVTILTDDPATAALADATRTQLTAAPLLQITKRDLLFIDADNDNQASPGDTLLYAIRIDNAGNAIATDLLITDTPDPQSTLVAGKVQINGGQVATGNRPGDQTVALRIPALAPQARIDAAFRVVVGVAAQTTLTNQAFGQYNNPNTVNSVALTTLSDDPDTPEPADPTVTPLREDAAVVEELFYLPLVNP